MRSIKGAFLALAVAALIPLGGCTTLEGIGQSLTGAPSPQTATTVGAAEQAYTTAAHLADLYLKSGKATPAQAAAITKANAAVYADIVAARTAVANGNSPAVAVALQTFNTDLPALSGLIPSQ